MTLSLIVNFRGALIYFYPLFLVRLMSIYRNDHHEFPTTDAKKTGGGRLVAYTLHLSPCGHCKLVLISSSVA